MADSQITPSPEIVTRKDALARGLKRYYTGKACKHGHVDWRYARNGECSQCVRDRAAVAYHANPEARKERARESFQRRYHSDEEYRKIVNSRNNERYHAMKHIWNANPDTVKRARERSAEWFRDQIAKNTEWAQERRKKKREAHHKKKCDPTYIEKRNASNRRLRSDPEYKKREALAKAEWRKNNLEAVRVDAHKRRRMIKASCEHHTVADVLCKLENQGYKCVYCEADLSEAYHIDHIMPLALGGDNSAKNIQCLCPPCNLSKGAKHPDDFAKEIGRL